MKIISKRKMALYYPKYAWRIAFVGFNSLGDAQYYIFNKKEALEKNPEMEYSIADNPIKQKGIL